MGLRLPPELEAKILSMADRVVTAQARPEAPVSARASPRHVTGEMNKTEARFVRQVLGVDALPMGRIHRWWFEQFNWRLAERCHYRPDFLVQLKDGSLLVIDVKARWSDGSRGKDDAIVKMRTFAKDAPLPLWAAIWNRKCWEYEEFTP